MALPEVARPVWTSDEGTMAQETARTRWEGIVQNMVDTVGSFMAKNTLRPQQKAEALDIQHQLRILRQEIISNGRLQPINLRGDPDERWYNKHLGCQTQLSWQAAPWLFAECYLYRRVQALFGGSVFWHDFDVFKDQKDSAFINSQTAVQDLAMQFIINVEQGDRSDDSELLRLKEFSDIIQVALWGNATDLSLQNRPSAEDLKLIQKRRFAAAVVDNDLDQLWSYLNAPAYKASDRNVDIVLDNAGFELLTDLVFAVYLMDRRIARKVTLHTKAFPWFVSDATPTDIASLMNLMRSAEDFPCRDYIDPLCDRIAVHLSAGNITTTQHWFWTTGSAFSDMPWRAPDLLQDLSKRDLVIFKGDLNYRKLTSDCLWSHTTPFKTALGQLGSGSGLKILALRTNKADVCVGLESEDQVNQLNQACPKGGWLRTGKYGVISFSDGE